MPVFKAQAAVALLDQVTSPATFAALLATRDGRHVASSFRGEVPGCDPNTLAALAGALWRREAASEGRTSSTQALSELGRIRVSATGPFLLVLAAHPAVPAKSVDIKAKLAEEVLIPALAGL